MNQENEPTLLDLPPSENVAESTTTPRLHNPGALASEPAVLSRGARLIRALRWVFTGSGGLRAGWSVLVFALIAVCSVFAVGAAATFLNNRFVHSKIGGFTAPAFAVNQFVVFLALLMTGFLVALIERRRILDYNLTGARRLLNLVCGLVAGFLALSALVGAMAWGGWLRFGPVALSGTQTFRFAALWGLAFLLTGFCEEGVFRCYLQFTLARGINFWWALGIIATLCLNLVLTDKGQGPWGIYAIALLGLIPCLLLHVQRAKGAGFWQAAWVTSTLFGFLHTGNNGENWIGVIEAAAFGFVLCVSVRVTGSAWWAIGCHAAWDWAETYFYGTANSGLVAPGHFLTTSPAGAVLWSGGTDGPEGSLLSLGAILFLLVPLLAIYGRKKAAVLTPETTGQLSV